MNIATVLSKIILKNKSFIIFLLDFAMLNSDFVNYVMVKYKQVKF